MLGHFSTLCMDGAAAHLQTLSERVPLALWAEIVDRAASDAAAGDAKARDWLSKYLMPQPGADEGGGLRPLVVEFVEAIPGERELVEDQR